MGRLLCSYASPRSRPEKIRSWIQDLRQLREDPAVAPDSRPVIERLLERAEHWLDEKPEAAA